jgi:catechol 2,3-dioxygenase-like lactoylglutathione lyase family enzyme
MPYIMQFPDGRHAKENDGMAVDVQAIRRCRAAEDLPFALTKLGHVVLNCSNLERSVRFYTEVLGLKISDVYGDGMMDGGMVFMRFNEDHHGIALVGAMGGPSPNVELNHLAFEVASLDEVVLARNHLRKLGVAIDFEGRRRAGVQIAVEFRDPDGHRLEIYWGLDRVKADGYIRPAHEWKGAKSLRDAIADPVKGQDTTLKDSSILDDAASTDARASGGKSRFE